MSDKKREMLNRIRVGRAEHRLTQAELAEKLGISRNALALIENGKHYPSIYLATEISEVLGIPVSKLFYFEKGVNSNEKTNG